MNQNIINLFELLINHIKVQIDNSSNKKDNIKHSFRLRQISNALKFIKKFPDEIKSSDQLKNIKGFGEGILNRIDQILKTNNLKELDQNNQTNINQKLIDQLDKIVGVGRKTALKLIDKYSLNSIEDLIKLNKNSKIELNNNIKLGLKYFNRYEQKIPHKTLFKIEQQLQKFLFKCDPKFIGIVTGSYRRLKPYSGDVDLLVFNPDIKTKKQLEQSHDLTKIYNCLKKNNFIIDSLTNKEPNTKYMGFANNQNITFRFDIRFLPFNSFYTALAYFTGSAETNRKMRTVALQQDMLLNEYGLFKNNKQIKIDSEIHLFKLLGLEYLHPELR